MDWLNHNAGALQALTAIAIALLTAVLIGVTWWYASWTRKMGVTMKDQAESMQAQVKAMQAQMIAAFQPSVGLAFSLRTTGSSGTPTGIEHTIGGFVRCVNNGPQPVKVISVKIQITF